MPESYKDTNTSEATADLTSADVTAMSGAATEAEAASEAATEAESVCETPSAETAASESSNGAGADGEGVGSEDEEFSPEQLTIDLPEEEKACEEPEETPSETAESISDLLLAKAPEYNPEKPRRVDSVFDFVELLLLTLAAVFVLTTFFLRHSIVNGGSMMNTLQNGDVLIISDFLYTPKQYDIVVLEDHTTGYDHPLVKRVIAVAGDEVIVTESGIFVNGEPVRDDFVYIGTDGYQYHPDSLTVPEGEIYVLGDHRDDSSDSRIFGSVSVDAVLGKVLFRLYPFAEFGSVYTEEK